MLQKPRGRARSEDLRAKRDVIYVRFQTDDISAPGYFAMPKKRKSGNGSSKVKAPQRLDDGLWIAPRYSLKGPTGDRTSENRPGGPPNSGRFLELADIAMGPKKSAPRKKSDSPVHLTGAKTEPYLK